METENAFLVICGTLVIVLFINVGILASLLRSNPSAHIKVFGKAIDAVREPWRKGEEDLKELHQRVSNLEKQPLEGTENEH